VYVFVEADLIDALPFTLKVGLKSQNKYIEFPLQFS
jgi:hypothetical protein